MATAVPKQQKKKIDPVWIWQGKEAKSGRDVDGEMQGPDERAVTAELRKRGIRVEKIKKQRTSSGKKITSKDIAIFTRQLAVMMKAGVPMLQAFDIVGRGAANPAIGKLLGDIRGDVESGISLSAAFRRQPKYFDALFCNLVEAGESAGILEDILDRLATYKEKTEALKSKIKSALFYPVAVIGVAVIITAIIMIFVVPAFKKVFAEFGADLPAPTLVVIACSDFMVSNWYFVFGGLGLAFYAFMATLKKNVKLQQAVDKMLLRAPIFGELVRKAVIARWTRTLSTMFAAGVPLVEALDSVGGASGNYVYQSATEKIRHDVSQGDGLTQSMMRTKIFPNMVLQMSAIGEESGSLDHMLSKVADFYEDEVDDAVKGISSLMEPLIMAILGIIIGGLVVAMYLPIFKLGSVV